MSKHQLIVPFYRFKTFVSEYQKVCEFMLSRALLPAQLMQKTCQIEFVLLNDTDSFDILSKDLLSSGRKVVKLNNLFSFLKKARGDGDVKNIKIVCLEEPCDEVKISVENASGTVKIRFSPNILAFVNLFSNPYKFPREEHVFEACASSFRKFYNCESILDLDFFFFDPLSSLKPNNVFGYIFCLYPEGGYGSYSYVLRTDVFLSNVCPVVEASKEVILERTRFAKWGQGHESMKK